MGWNLDYSAITPGPGGTVMLGERGIEAAARRGRERLRREAMEREQAAAEKDTMSEATLVPQVSQASEPNKGGNTDQKDVPAKEASAESSRDGKRASGEVKKESRFREWARRHLA